jgi:hypothetical protein
MLCEQILQLSLYSLLYQLTGSSAQQFRQRVPTRFSTFKLNHVTLFHGGVSLGCLAVSQQQINLMRRLFSTPQTPDSIIALLRND